MESDFKAVNPFSIHWLKKHWMYLLILMCMVLLAYLNALHAELVSDDIFAIKDSEPLLRSVKYLFINPTFFTRSILFYIAYKIGGIDPFFYRFYNIIFHIGVVWMAFILVPFFSKKKLLPFIVAAFVSIHPVMVESVTWISGGIYAESFFFLLVSFFLYLSYRLNSKKKYYIFSVIFFIFALSSSEKAIVYPGILFLYEFLFYNVKKTGKSIIPYAVLSGFWILLLIPQIGPRIEFIQADSGIMVQPINPLIQIPVVIFTYFKLLFWPTDLTLYHSEFALTLVQVFMSYITVFAVIGYGIYTYQKNKLYFFWLAFFFILLSPTLTPFGISALVAERYVYGASIGIYFIVGSYLSKLIENKKYDIAGYCVFFLMICSLLIRTMIRNNDWKTASSLWKATAEVSPNNPKSLNNVADQYVQQGNYEKAAEILQQAINLNPNFTSAYHNLGHIYQLNGNKEQAIAYYKKALELNPKLWQTHSNLSEIYVADQNYKLALEELLKADATNPNNPNIYHNIGHVYQKMGNLEKAVEYYNKVLLLSPNFVQTFENLGVVYFTKGDYPTAITYFKKAIAVTPDNSKLYASIGVVYLRSGNKEFARQAFEKALSLNPKEPLAQSGLQELKR